jgi:hypothetical protein
MTDLTDNFAEVYMGAYGMVTFPRDGTITDVTHAPCAEGLAIVSKIQKEFTAGKDDDLLNILADMQSLLNKSKYLLKEKVGKVETETEDEGEEEKSPSSPPKVVEAAKRTYTK